MHAWMLMTQDMKWTRGQGGQLGRRNDAGNQLRSIRSGIGLSTSRYLIMRDVIAEALKQTRNNAIGYRV